MGKIMFEMESVVNRSAPSEIPDSEVSKMLEDLNECSEQQKLLVPSRVEVSKNVSQWSQAHYRLLFSCYSICPEKLWTDRTWVYIDTYQAIEMENMYMPYASLALVSITLGAIYHQHSQYSIPLYKAHMRPILILHIVSGLTELLGLYIQPLLHTHDKIPDSIDLTLCLAQSGTNMALVKRMARGQWKMTRPSYQAGALLRPVLTILGMIYQRSDLHTSSLQILHAFIYTRYLIYLWSKTALLNKHSDIYMMAVFCAAILAMMDTPFPAVLSKAYILCVAGISLLNRWTSQQLEEDTSRHSKIKIDLLNLLVFLGLADLPTLKGGEPSDMVKDDYCGDLGIEEAGDESLPDARKYLCDPEHGLVE